MLTFGIILSAALKLSSVNTKFHDLSKQVYNPTVRSVQTGKGVVAGCMGKIV